MQRPVTSLCIFWNGKVKRAMKCSQSSWYSCRLNPQITPEAPFRFVMHGSVHPTGEYAHNHTQQPAYLAAASLGSSPSTAWRPTLLRSWASLLAGSRRPALEASLVPMLASASERPEPTLTVLASADCQSEVAGGCSGRGRLALRSSMVWSFDWVMSGAKAISRVLHLRKDADENSLAVVCCVWVVREGGLCVGILAYGGEAGDVMI
ncbi:uncharacterized protein F5Z01DRAFT_248046 [Emericellopsis atlantica]|uniref:Uncharacterized protein n=1 Tax=Emericellopsis atlantica TaxID=2614577 RepID=A0A9P7ZHR9_9HYPO|nr:uncharacterized protein F5Z01DRAFT_248046 [Emericellopsis atlantica]KAG9252067.1 hypothetical protein F5Z01DRAFT_248046 [Emericellopsis atlantica]